MLCLIDTQTLAEGGLCHYTRRFCTCVNGQRETANEACCEADCLTGHCVKWPGLLCWIS